MALSLISKLWTKISNKRAPQSIMIIGLDNSGKTSILNYLAELNSTSYITSKNVAKSNKLHQDSDSHLSSSLLSTSSDRDKQNNNISFQESNNILPTAGYNYERIQYKGLTLTVLDFSGKNKYRNLWQEFYNSIDGIVFVIDSSDLIRFVVARDELETMLNHPYFSSLDNNQQQFNDLIMSNCEQSSSGNKLLSSSLTVQKQLTISQGKLFQSPLETASSPVINSNMSNKTTSMGCRGCNKSGNIFQNQQKRYPNQLKRRTKVPIVFLANKTDLANSVDTEIITKALNLNQLSPSRHPWFIQATSVTLNQGIVEGIDWLITEMSTSIN